MNILILSGNTGGGHNTAAKAIKNYFESMGDKCDIKDAMAFLSSSNSYIISNGHIFIYKKMPKLFGLAYKFEENHPAKANSESLMYTIVTLGAKKLYAFLEENNYDAVICTHVFSSMLITKVKKKYDTNIKSYFIVTDYTCYPGVSEIHADGYFIPHENLREEFEGARLEKDRIIATGIPVSENFYSSTEKSEAKKKLGLPPDKRIVLMMCGSMGCGPLKDISEMFDKELPDNAHIVVICGNNKNLEKSLKRRSKKYNKTTIVGYTDDMNTYLDASDIILTKAGGLSTTEILVKKKPLVLIDAIPGCESKNRDFLTSLGLARMGTTVEELFQIVNRSLTDDEFYNECLKASQSYNYHAVKTIYDFVKK